jgi:hypothetical protein
MHGPSKALIFRRINGPRCLVDLSGVPPLNDRPLNNDFADVLSAMRSGNVEFLVIGAHAMAFHGVPRATADLDLLVRPSASNADRVVRALRAFGAPLDSHGVTASDFAVTGHVYRLGSPPKQIDIHTSISGVSFEDAWTTRQFARLHGVEIAVLSREALVQNKRAAARGKDLVDLELLEKTRPTNA